MRFNVAGGPRYHWRAWQYRKTLWEPFFANLRDWMNQWQPISRDLLWIGSSAGYSIDPKWLSSFNQIEIFEPDPIARLIFNRRFPDVIAKVRWHPRFLSLSEMIKEISLRPTSGILFSNLIGQLKFIFPEEFRSSQFQKQLEELRRLLDRREWISFHDKISGNLRPIESFPFVTPSHLDCRELADRCFNRSGELLDHETDILFSSVAADRTYFLWQIKPHFYHLIEGIFAVRGQT